MEADGGTREDGGSDADAGGPACDLDGAFMLPVALGELNTGFDEARPSLTADELVIVFQRAPPGESYDELVMAVRPTAVEPFGTPTKLAEINSGAPHNADPWISRAGDRLLFASSPREGIDNYDIWESTRPSRTSSWSKPSRLAGSINSPASDTYPFLAADGLWFVSGRSDTGTAGPGEIYFAPSVDGALDTPARRDELASGQGERSPVLTADGLRIYFASFRDGARARGANIWTATRNAVGVSFDTPTPVVELNTDQSEAPAFVSPDGCRLYFNRGAQDDAGGSGDLYFASKPRR